MPASLAARACGFICVGREGEAESRVVRGVGFADLSRLREGEAARRAARECIVTAVGVSVNVCVVGEGVGGRTAFLDFCGFGHGGRWEWDGLGKVVQV